MVLHPGWPDNNALPEKPLGLSGLTPGTNVGNNRPNPFLAPSPRAANTGHSVLTTPGTPACRKPAGNPTISSGTLMKVGAVRLRPTLLGKVQDPPDCVGSCGTVWGWLQGFVLSGPAGRRQRLASRSFSACLEPGLRRHHPGHLGPAATFAGRSRGRDLVRQAENS